MWKTLTLLCGTVVFSLIGLIVTTSQPVSDRMTGAVVGAVGGFVISYLCIVIGVSSDRPK